MKACGAGMQGGTVGCAGLKARVVHGVLAGNHALVPGPGLYFGVKERKRTGAIHTSSIVAGL